MAGGEVGEDRRQVQGQVGGVDEDELDRPKVETFSEGLEDDPGEGQRWHQGLPEHRRGPNIEPGRGRALPPSESEGKDIILGQPVAPLSWRLLCLEDLDIVWRAPSLRLGSAGSLGEA